MKYKISKRDVAIILGFIGVLVLGLTYYFIYMSYSEKTEQLKTANAGLQSRVDVLQSIADQQEQLIADARNFEQKSEEIFNHYPAGFRDEDGFMMAVDLQAIAPLDSISTVTNSDPVSLYNFEDVKGMIHIVDILSYSDLLASDIRYISHEADGEKLRIELETDICLPSSINKIREYGIYIIKGNRIYVTLNLFNGTLCTFLPDHKNYYYLIDEDMIIPRSLGESIDKSNRRPASRRDCKVSAEGTYVALPLGIDAGTTRVFKESYETKASYVAIDDIKPELLIKITRYMLKH